MNDFEKQLGKLRPRSAPSDLRRDVLTACEEVKKSESSPGWSDTLLDFFYPGRKLTISLAAVWLLILAFRLDTPENLVPSGPPFSLVQFQESKLEQAFILARLESPRFEADLNKGFFSIPKEDLKTN